jgi:hypothetical protein
MAGFSVNELRGLLTRVGSMARQPKLLVEPDPIAATNQPTR